MNQSPKPKVVVRYALPTYRKSKNKNKNPATVYLIKRNNRNA